MQPVDSKPEIYDTWLQHLRTLIMSIVHEKIEGMSQEMKNLILEQLNPDAEVQEGLDSMIGVGKLEREDNSISRLVNKVLETDDSDETAKTLARIIGMDKSGIGLAKTIMQTITLEFAQEFLGEQIRDEELLAETSSMEQVYAFARQQNKKYLEELESIVIKIFVLSNLLYTPSEEIKELYPNIYSKLQDLMETSPLPHFQNFYFHDVFELSHLSICSFILAIAARNTKRYLLQQSTARSLSWSEGLFGKKYASIYISLASFLITLNSQQDQVRIIAGSFSNRDTDAQFYFPGYLIYYLHYYYQDEITAEHLKCSLEIMQRYHERGFQALYYSTERFFDSNFKFLWWKNSGIDRDVVKQAAKAFGPQDIFTNYFDHTADAVHRTYWTIRNAQGIIPLHFFSFTDMDFHDRVLLLAGTPSLCFSYLVLRVYANILKCEQKLPKNEVRKAYQEIAMSDEKVEEVKEYILQLFFELGSISLLISRYQFRTNQFIAGGRTLSLKALQVCVDTELEQLKTVDIREYMNIFLSIVHREMFAEVLPNILFQQDNPIISIGECAQQWLQLFKQKQQKFIYEWGQIIKLGSWRSMQQEQQQSLVSAAIHLACLWKEQPAGMPFFEEMLDGVPQALILHCETVQKSSQDYRQGADLIKIKMVVEERTLEQLSEDEFCILMLDAIILHPFDSKYLSEVLYQKLPNLDRENFFTQVLIREIFKVNQVKRFFDQNVELLKVQQWYQDLYTLVDFGQMLTEPSATDLPQDLFEEYTKLLVLRPCCCERSVTTYLLGLIHECSDQQVQVVCITLWLVNYLRQDFWESLLVDLIKLAYPLSEKSAQVLLWYAPGVVLERVFNETDGENAVVMKRTMVNALSELVYQQVFNQILFKSPFSFVDMSELKNDPRMFQGELIRRGMQLKLTDTNFIQALMDKVHHNSENYSDKFEAFLKIVNKMNEFDCWDMDMIRGLITKTKTNGLDEGDIFNLLDLVNFDKKSKEELLTNELETTLISGNIPQEFEPQLRKMSEKQNQTRLLVCIFNFSDKTAFSLQQKRQYIERFKMSIPSACLLSDDLITFISQQDQSTVQWFAQFGTADELNNVIRNENCALNLKMFLSRILIQDNLLEKNSVQTLLTRQDIEQEFAESLLRYAQLQNMDLDVDCFVNIFKVFGTIEFDRCLQYGYNYSNKFIKAAQLQQKPQLVIDIIAHMESQEKLNAMGLDGFILASKQLQLQKDALWVTISHYEKEIKDAKFIDQISIYAIELILELVEEFDRSSYLQYVQALTNSSRLDQKQLMQLLLPKLLTLQQCLNMDDDSVIKEQKDVTKQILTRSLELGINAKNIQQAIIQVFSNDQSWQFSQRFFFEILYKLVQQGHFVSANELLQCTDQVIFREIEAEKIQQFFDVIEQKLVQLDRGADNGVVHLLDSIFQQEFVQKGYFVLQVTLCVFKSCANSLLGESLLQNYFREDVQDVDTLSQLITIIAENYPEVTLPESLIRCVERNLDILINLLSPQSIIFCANSVCNIADDATLQCYQYIHSKYKQEVSSQLWKSALISADNVYDYEQGFEILNHIPQEKRFKTDEWKLDTERLRLAEINIFLGGKKDVNIGQEMLKQFCSDYDVIPQQQIIALFQLLIEQANPYLCSKAVEQIMDIFQRKESLHSTITLELVSSMVNVVLLSDNSLDKLNIIIYLLLISLRNNQLQESKDRQLTSSLLSQCLLCCPALLPALVAIEMCIGIISDELFNQLEVDKSAQLWFRKTLKIDSIVDFLLGEEDMDALTSICQKRKYKDKVIDYLQSLQYKQSNQYKGQQENGLIYKDAGEEAEWQDFGREQWLKTLALSSNWKQWPDDKLTICAKVVIGRKFKKYKQRKDIIQVLEKRVDQALG